jgi:hypothetical protein
MGGSWRASIDGVESDSGRSPSDYRAGAKKAQTQGVLMPLLDLFWTMLWFFLFFIWIWLLISIFSDLFQSEMSGWAKAGWVIFLIVLPLLGALIYLTVNGGDMQRRGMKQAADYEKAQREYIQSVAGSGSSADELAKLAQLRDSGALTDAEFQAQKAKLLA